jgi:ubiquinone/menaquinone biosynthesis C-methylase UbiE
MTFSDAKQRFSSRAADYLRYRPGYPAALLDLLRTECGLRPDSVIADLGSGTGILSELFLKNGNRVFGVEPNPEMREAGEVYLKGYSGFTSVNGSAEATTLPDRSVRLVTAGQAFHWFEPALARKEFVRILKPGGWVVVVWNSRRASQSQFVRDYEDLLVRFGTDYGRLKKAYPEPLHMRVFFGHGNFLVRELPNEENLDQEGLAGGLRSSSYMPQEDHSDFPLMLAELQRIFEAHQTCGRDRLV